MARRRLQQKGDLQKEGGWWVLRWHEDKIQPDGTIKRGWSPRVKIGPAVGNPAMKGWTEKEARRVAWENYLSRLDQHISLPGSVITFADFLERRYRPDHIMLLAKSTRELYESLLSRHILPVIGSMQLREIRRDQVQAVIARMQVAKLSSQTLRHARNVVSSVFRLAEDCEMATGNPARKVRLPEIQRKGTRHLTLNQLQALVSALESPDRELVLMLALTGMNIAEALGLTWAHVNLTAEARPLFDPYPKVSAWQDSILPAWSIGVRRQWVRAEYGPTKQKTRLRNIPIPEVLGAALLDMSRRDSYAGPDDPIFVGRSGKPIDARSRLRDHLVPAAAKVGMGTVGKNTRSCTSWVSWHALRRTFATLTDHLQMPAGTRQSLLGHASAAMTGMYTRTTSEEARAQMNDLGRRVTGVIQ